MRALVIHASHEGQTHQVAERICQRLRAHDVPADGYNVIDSPPEEIAIDAYDAVIVGSPLHFGAHDSLIAWCIQEYRGHLARVPTAFFSVSLGMMSVHEKEVHNAIRLADDFLSSMNWEPNITLCLSGALRASSHGFFTKHLMHWIATQSGSETKMDRDHEPIDWNAVDKFAREFAVLVHENELRRRSERPKDILARRRLMP